MTNKTSSLTSFIVWMILICLYEPKGWDNQFIHTGWIHDDCVWHPVLFRRTSASFSLFFPNWIISEMHYNAPLSGLQQLPHCPPYLAFIILFYGYYSSSAMNDLSLWPFLCTHVDKDVCVRVQGMWMLIPQLCFCISAAHFLLFFRQHRKWLGHPHNLQSFSHQITPTDLFIKTHKNLKSQTGR